MNRVNGGGINGGGLSTVGVRTIVSRMYAVGGMVQVGGGLVVSAGGTTLTADEAGYLVDLVTITALLVLSITRFAAEVLTTCITDASQAVT